MEANQYFSTYKVNVDKCIMNLYWIENATHEDQLYDILQLMGLLETLIIKETIS